MNEEVLQGNIAAFREFASQQMLTIVGEREIQFGHQFQVSDGLNKVSVSLYRSGKALIQGKDCEIKSRIEAWWNQQIPSTPNPQPALNRSNTAKFFVKREEFDTVKQLLLDEIKAEIEIKDLADAQLVFRIDFREQQQHVVVLLYQTGTLLVQGKIGTLFESVYRVLETLLPQSFAERGASYVPANQYDQVSRALSQPNVKQNSTEWIHQELGKEIFEFLFPGDQKTYAAGVGLLLLTANHDLVLDDYSVLVMPFARAYEGFILRLAHHRKMFELENWDRDKNSAGNCITRMEKEGVDPKIIIDLREAWKQVRHEVAHSDPKDIPFHKELVDAKNDIGLVNRAMRRSYEYLVKRDTPET